MNLEHLTQAIGRIHASAQMQAGQAINRVLNWRNWLIGAYIVEFEQGGEDRAAYGEKVLEILAGRLKASGHRGLSLRNLKNFKLWLWLTRDLKFGRHCLPFSQPKRIMLPPIFREAGFGRQCLPNCRNWFTSPVFKEKRRTCPGGMARGPSACLPRCPFPTSWSWPESTIRCNAHSTNWNASSRDGRSVS